jgi:uncharacterized protein (TIGR02996 family)
MTHIAGAVDLDAAIAHAFESKRPILVLIVDSGLGAADNDARAFLEDPRVQGKRDRMTSVLIDLRVSRNRATAARFHVTDTPMLVCLSPKGVIVHRDEKPITIDLLLERIDDTVHGGYELDNQFASLEEAIAKNPNDPTARLNLADFLLDHHNAREAIASLASVAGSESVETSVRVRASVARARAHLWIAEPEKGRHVADDLIATLGQKSPEARAGGSLVLGLQDANAKRVALARREFEEAIAAAPESVYAKQAADAISKLPGVGK